VGAGLADKDAMLVSIALFAAGFPLAVAVERLILQLARMPLSDWLHADEVPEPRTLPWQTPRWRGVLARAFALSLPLLLLVTALGFESWDALVAGVVVVALVTCCATDLLAYRVANAVTLPALAVVLVAAGATGRPELTDALAGMAACGGSMLGVAVLTRGGLGGGDVKLVALIGAALGLPEALFALGGGIVVGSLVVIVLHAMRRLQRGDVFPYAPFLSVAALVVYLI
jgi:Flp pilus assembly protein protease CpaA